MPWCAVLDGILFKTVYCSDLVVVRLASWVPLHMRKSKKPSPKWADLFCRAKNSPSRQPHFSLKGARPFLFSFDGYEKGSFGPLDAVLDILESEDITGTFVGSGAPGYPVQTHEWTYGFETANSKSSLQTTLPMNLIKARSLQGSGRSADCWINLD